MLLGRSALWSLGLPALLAPGFPRAGAGARLSRRPGGISAPRRAGFGPDVTGSEEGSPFGAAERTRLPRLSAQRSGAEPSESAPRLRPAGCCSSCACRQDWTPLLGSPDRVSTSPWLDSRPPSTGQLESSVPAQEAPAPPHPAGLYTPLILHTSDLLFFFFNFSNCISERGAACVVPSCCSVKQHCIDYMMEINWIIQLLLFLALSLVFVAAIPEEKQGNFTDEMYLKADKNVTDDLHALGVTTYKIMTAQYECYQKIAQASPRNYDEPHCNSTWDGWLCWDDVAAGKTAVQNCPDYFQDFDPSEKVYKTCEQNGHWFVHPDSNRTWTNFSQCNARVKFKLQTALNMYYLTIIGHSLSLVSLLISLGIFFYFKSLSCQRITLHKNLFFSFVCNSVVTIICLTGVANNQQLVAANPVGCKVAHFLQLYLLVCNYFWMLCEGVYLHTLIVVAVFAEKQHLMWYYLLGWGFPLIPACIHAVARSIYFNDNCWIRSDTHLLYIVHGPICAALLVNLFFLLNIVRVLITKLKVTHQAESNLYMKAVRATLILVPLLGIEFVLFPWRPEGRIAEEIHDYVMHILMHYQGLLVATIFCFFNGEVQSVLRRHWNQYRIQFEHSFAHSDGLRSASYTVSSSITDGQSFTYNHDCTSEHLNGKTFHDLDNVVFKADKLYG